jgi:hypothetical protein
VPRDRHHEPEIALDQPALCLLVAEILAPRELPLLCVRQKPAVADLADVELQRILRRRFGRILRPVVGHGVEERLGKVAFHATRIGAVPPPLEASARR